MTRLKPLTPDNFSQIVGEALKLYQEQIKAQVVAKGRQEAHNNVSQETDNGWFRIPSKKPSYNEEVVVILERDACCGCSYEYTICKSVYRDGYFLDENSEWKVRYWRRENIYPDAIIHKEIEECRKNNVKTSIF